MGDRSTKWCGSLPKTVAYHGQESHLAAGPKPWGGATWIDALRKKMPKSSIGILLLTWLSIARDCARGRATAAVYR